jgi:putative flippase GtrA
MTTGSRTTFLRFVTVGVLNTTVGLATVIAASEWLGANAFIANAAGLLAGNSLGFQLNRLWTFRGSRSDSMTALRYILAFIFSYSVNLGILALGLRTGLQPILAQGAALAAYSLIFFVLCRVMVFPVAR